MSSNALFWLKNGRVIDPASGRDAVGDLFVKHGFIVETLDADERAAARVLDVGGLVVAPGFVDLHARLGEPGNKARETIRSGSLAAAAGGFTTVVVMPDTSPPADNAGTLRLIKSIARHEAVVNVLPTGTVTLGCKGENLAPIGSLKAAGAVAVGDGTTGGLLNNEIMRRALEYSSMFNLVVLDHCQDSSMTAGAVMHEGEWSTRLGLRGFPAAAEEIVVASDILLSHLTGARVHLQHLTSRGSLQLVRNAKATGTPVTAEVSANHLLLTDALLANYDTNLKLAAPLRTEDDRRALLDALRDGTLDAIVSDHAPVTPTEKDREFDYAPAGSIGLETALAAAITAFADDAPDAPLPLSLIVKKLTCSPANALGLKSHDHAVGTLAAGAPADITVFDPNEEWTLDPNAFHSRSRNCALLALGRPLRGRVKKTFVNGKIVFEHS